MKQRLNKFITLFKAERIVLFLLSSVLFLYPALFNGYPLFTSDSGAYIASGFENWIPIDRPVFYGLFVRHSSLAASLWFTILFQSIIILFLIWQVLNKFVVDYFSRIAKISILLLVSFFTSVSWYTSQIMPDIFIGIGLLSFVLILLPGNNYFRFFNSIILIISCLSHNSHIVIFTLLLFVFFILLIFKKFRELNINNKNVLVLILIIASSWFLIPLINYSISDKYEFSGAPHVFLMAKNIENGIVDRYLEENCDKYLERRINDTSAYYIAVKHSKKLLDVAGPSKEEGAFVHQWTYLGAPNQKFQIIGVSDNFFKIKSTYSNLFVQPSDTTQSATIIMKNNNGSNLQLFQFIRTEADSGTYFIKNVATGKFLTVINSAIEDGAKIGFEKIVGADNQQFNVVKGNNCLCLFKDELPSSAIVFIWHDGGPFSKTGAWGLSKEEYTRVLDDIYFRYTGAVIGESIIATFRQLTRNDIGDGVVGFDNKSGPYGAVKKHFRFELKSFVTSKQNIWMLSFVEINKRNFWILLFSLVVLTFWFFNRKHQKNTNKNFILLVYVLLLGILLNAFVTASLANVLDRLQSRVIWLLPLLSLIICYNYIQYRLKAYFTDDKK